MFCSFKWYFPESTESNISIIPNIIYSNFLFNVHSYARLVKRLSYNYKIATIIIENMKHDLKLAINLKKV